MLFVLICCGCYGFCHLLGFLAIQVPAHSDDLIMDTWIVDLPNAVRVYKSGHYHRVFLTGGPKQFPNPLHAPLNYPEMMRNALVSAGLLRAAITPVPAPFEQTDRTFSNAVAIRRWFDAHGGRPSSIDVVTVAEAARRTRLIYQRVLGDGVRVGVIPAFSRDYDPDKWWDSSQGVRDVLVELVEYLAAVSQVGAGKP